MALESVKTFVVEWLDWAARYAAKEPQDFFSKLFLIMLPLFAISGVLAFLLLREMQKEEKKSAKKEKIVRRAKNAKKKKQS